MIKRVLSIGRNTKLPRVRMVKQTNGSYTFEMVKGSDELVQRTIVKAIRLS